jgi:Tol biopolymer transport system component
MNADGSGRRNLTRNPAHDADPVWSPDGRKLAFISDRDGSYDVWRLGCGSGERGCSDLLHDPARQTLHSDEMGGDRPVAPLRYS